MNFPDSVRFLYALGNEVKTLKLGLEQMQNLAARLGHPERRLRFVHVAGTNGKGSVCAMVEAGLRHAGQTTGLYTSPHLASPTERIRINGEPVTEEEFSRAFDQVHEAAQGMEVHPSYFETVTAMALVLFAEKQVDTVVWEVGLGGRLDATNIVTPVVSVITPVSLDHQEHLGDTVTKIAFEKAGIIKAGVPVVVAPQWPEAMAAIVDKAHAEGAPVILSGPVELPFPPPLAGKHQLDNCRTAVAALAQLGVGPEGIAETRWPGRLELVGRAPDIYLDGAHNPAGAAALAEFIEERRAAGKGRIWMVFGVMKDKKVAEMAGHLFPLVDELILTAPISERALPPEAIPANGARVVASVPEALSLIRAAAPEDTVFITGSLFLVGEARPLLVNR
ncbi:MAG: bifunctional folylpolyglutamate synthase/dihydrofolate synthase [Acidobacteria bacterium]|nr:bifunctional folylpolyglutamate synthase/dihydrofolate synthase [Acidobacteriota bacterium]